MSNYTKPDDPNHQDSPQDWLNSALILTRAMGIILKEMEGIVVNVVGDVKFPETVKQVVVYKQDDMIRIIACEEERELEEGSMVWMHPISPN